MSGRASRRAELGQHFLAGGWLAAELVAQAGVGADDLVVEIGAGTGVLTEALARRAGRVVANLPFGSTAAILRWLLGDPRSRLERADLIVQEQAARRYAVVRPGTPERIIWWAWYQLSIGRRLGPGCFRPPLVPVGDHRRFTRLVEGAFRVPQNGDDLGRVGRSP